MQKDEILNLLYTGEKSNINLAFKEAKAIDFDLIDYFGLDRWKEFKLSKFKLFGSTELDLSKGLKDGKLLLPYIHKLKHLEHLSLYDKQIQNIDPGTFEDMPHLKSLQFGGWGDNDCIPTLLPKTFMGLDNLTVLQLFRNKMENVEPHAFAGLNNLEELNIGQNNIIELKCDTFCGLEKLSKLSLDNNSITTLEEGCFNSLTNVKEITLFNNLLEKLPEHLFKSLANLEILILGKCANLKAFDIGYLKHTPKLKDIRIWDTAMSEEEVTEIKKATD